MSTRLFQSVNFTFTDVGSVSAGQGTIFEQCQLVTDGAAVSSLIQCISDVIQENNQANTNDRRTWYFVLTGITLFFMQTGFAMLCAGGVRKKSVRNTMLKNLLDACGAAISWFAIGFAFTFGGDNLSGDVTFLGTEKFFSSGVIDYAFWFFEYGMVSTCATIVAGTVAERCQMASYLGYSMFLSAFVYPVVAHLMWSSNGWLSPNRPNPYLGVGAIDFAGSAVVHITGGVTALIATIILGARKGRFHDRKGRLLARPRVIRGHSIALQLLGALALWFGWYGFDCGASLTYNTMYTGAVAGRVAVNLTIAAGCGALSSMFGYMLVHERQTGIIVFDIAKSINGVLSALVAINSGAATVENWAAGVIGIISGLFYLGASNVLVKFRLDDAVDAIPVHLPNGIWGMVACGLFSSPAGMEQIFGSSEYVGWFYSIGRGSLNATLLGNQLLAVVLICLWVGACMTPYFLFLNFMGWFRSDSLGEMVGLDLVPGGGKKKLASANHLRIYDDDDDDDNPAQEDPDSDSDDGEQDKIAVEASKFYDEDQSDAS